MSHQKHPKEDSKVIITSNTNLTEGDNLTIKLTDLNGTPLANQEINLSVVSSSGGFNQKVQTTDSQGQCNMTVDNSTIGNCVVKVKYAGNEEFNGCNFTDNIIINKKVVIPVKTNSTLILGSNRTLNQSYVSYGNSDIITVEEY